MSGKLISGHHCCFYRACALKWSFSRLFTYLHVAYDKALSGSIVKHCLGTPLGMQWPVTVEQAYGKNLTLVPLSLICTYTRPVLHSQGPTSISFLPTDSFNDFITQREYLFPFSRTALASDMPGIGLTCPGRRWIMHRVLGVLEFQSSTIIPFTQAGCRLSWLD